MVLHSRVLCVLAQLRFRTWAHFYEIRMKYTGARSSNKVSHLKGKICDGVNCIPEVGYSSTTIYSRVFFAALIESDSACYLSINFEGPQWLFYCQRYRIVTAYVHPERNRLQAVLLLFCQYRHRNNGASVRFKSVQRSINWVVEYRIKQSSNTLPNHDGNGFWYWYAWCQGDSYYVMVWTKTNQNIVCLPMRIFQ